MNHDHEVTTHRECSYLIDTWIETPHGVANVSTSVIDDDCTDDGDLIPAYWVTQIILTEPHDCEGNVHSITYVGPCDETARETHFRLAAAVVSHGAPYESYNVQIDWPVAHPMPEMLRYA